ncbi:hypothetical protein A3709_20165 [Halioglobus sp. HI00S01]|uniref:hypothetical protein n=1 Tax=Halioglobus sp. HI00S01 TaxID=1822214 RepID=UPI0007C3DBE5|nr:hypothetical protein [Halioglobus sp. HI00S01]KZX57942.1 hypothetical protein A3709_20165 [Halioglobus sp. HI00S01]
MSVDHTQSMILISEMSVKDKRSLWDHLKAHHPSMCELLESKEFRQLVSRFDGKVYIEERYFSRPAK